MGRYLGGKQENSNEKKVEWTRGPTTHNGTSKNKKDAETRMPKSGLGQKGRKKDDRGKKRKKGTKNHKPVKKDRHNLFDGTKQGGVGWLEGYESGQGFLKNKIGEDKGGRNVYYIGKVGVGGKKLRTFKVV